jgi:HEAT repeat protein
MRALEPLITALKDDEDSYVCVAHALRALATAYALGQPHDQRAIQPLIAAFSDETNGVRYSATQALAQFGACTVEPLLLFLKREDKHSNAVSQVFLLMNDNQAIYPLLATLEDEDSRMPAYAARFLSHFDDPQVIPPLRKALEDADSWVRHYAHFSPGRLGHRPPPKTESLA